MKLSKKGKLIESIVMNYLENKTSINIKKLQSKLDKNLNFKTLLNFENSKNNFKFYNVFFENKLIHLTLNKK